MFVVDYLDSSVGLHGSSSSGIEDAASLRAAHVNVSHVAITVIDYWGESFQEVNNVHVCMYTHDHVIHDGY